MNYYNNKFYNQNLKNIYKYKYFINNKILPNWYYWIYLYPIYYYYDDNYYYFYDYKTNNIIYSNIIFDNHILLPNEFIYKKY